MLVASAYALARRRPAPAGTADRRHRGSVARGRPAAGPHKRCMRRRSETDRVMGRHRENRPAGARSRPTPHILAADRSRRPHHRPAGGCSQQLRLRISDRYCDMAAMRAPTPARTDLCQRLEVPIGGTLQPLHALGCSAAGVGCTQQRGHVRGWRCSRDFCFGPLRGNRNARSQLKTQGSRKGHSWRWGDASIAQSKRA